MAARTSDEYALPEEEEEDEEVRVCTDGTAALKAGGEDDEPAPAHPAMASVETMAQAIPRKLRRHTFMLRASVAQPARERDGDAPAMRSEMHRLRRAFDGARA
jgi:hypothetical protein